METLEDILGARDIPPYLTPKQVGKLLQFAPSTIRRKCAAGEFEKAFKFGEDGDWRIPSRFFERQLLLAEQRREWAA